MQLQRWMKSSNTPNPKPMHAFFAKGQSALEFLLILGALMAFLAVSLGSLATAQKALHSASVASVQLNALESICSTSIAAMQSGVGSRLSVPFSLAANSTRFSYDHYTFILEQNHV